MEPLEFDFSFPRGDTCPVSFNLTDADGEALTPTSATEIYFTLKNNYNETSFILQKRLSTGAITVVDGLCSFTLTHADTAALSYGKYNYDIQLKENGYVKTLVIGEIELTSEATHLANE